VTHPECMIQYYVFQRELWQPQNNWKMVKKVGEIDPFGKDAALFQ
jgi:precorrin-6x reductase